MSWAEDEGYDAWDIPEYVGNEEHWKAGFHYDQSGKEYKLTEMSDSHLYNTIKFFSSKGWNVLPLEKETKRRGY